jgi:hypothetical protein
MWEVLDWFKSYLCNRKQKVELKSSNTQNFYSIWEIIKLLVPLGSVLGPLLFNIYVHDFPLQSDSHTEVMMFADDTSILVCHNNYDEFIEVLNHVILRITKWFKVNWLALNIGKTSVVRFIPTNFTYYPLNLVYIDQTLTELDNLKFLGLQLDNDLMGFSTACLIKRRLSHILGIDAIRSAYYAPFH